MLRFCPCWISSSKKLASSGRPCLWRDKTPARSYSKFFPLQALSCLAKMYKSSPKYTNSLLKCSKISKFPAMARPKSKFFLAGVSWRGKMRLSDPRNSRIPRPSPTFPAKGCLGKKMPGLSKKLSVFELTWLPSSNHWSPVCKEMSG